MATTNINIRMDSDLKKQFEAFCTETGMTMTTAFNIFAKKVVRECRIPFEIRLDEPNETTYAAMQAAENEEDLYGPFDSVADMMEALNA